MAHFESWKTEPSSSADNTNSETSPWVYRPAMELNGVPYAGEFSVYSGGGYVADLIGPRNHVIEMASRLVNNDWIDKHTRLFLVEFTVYNPNINLFTAAQISFELSTTGIIAKMTHLYTFRLFSYLGGFGIFVILCELAAFACVVYFIFLEVKQLKRDGKKHFKRFWNCIQFLTLLTSVTCVVKYLLRHAMTTIAVENVKKLKDKFYNFQRIAVWDEMFQILLAFAIFSSILKVIHILRFNKRMSMLAETLQLSAKEMSAFSLVFGIVLFAFVASGHFMFGSNIAGFKNCIQGFETLLTFSLGSFDFNAITGSFRTLGPIYVFFFFIFVMFVLMNMFVTILNEAFAMVHNDVRMQQNEYELFDFVWCNLKKWIGIDLDNVIEEMKMKYFKGKKPLVDESSYTLDDIDQRLDIMMSSIDHMCDPYIIEKAARDSSLSYMTLFD